MLTWDPAGEANRDGPIAGFHMTSLKFKLQKLLILLIFYINEV